MTRYRGLCFALGFFALAGSLLFVARRLYAGPERITVSCTGENVPCPAVVPVTVYMNSDGPDYVDMTYTASVNGTPVSCSPSSNRLYVSKGNPAVDNVTVNCTSGTAAFGALGTGEAGGDTGGCSCAVQCSRCAPADKAKGGAAPKAAPKLASTVAVGHAHAMTAATGPVQVAELPAPNSPNYVWVVPLEIRLAAGQDQVQLQYSATATGADGSTISPNLNCVPASEFVNLYYKTLPQADVPAADVNGLVMRHVAVRASQAMATLTLKVTATALTTANTNNGVWSFLMNHASSSQTPIQQNAGAGSGGNIYIGFNPNTGAGAKRTMIRFVEHVFQLSATLVPDNSLFLKFTGEDSNSQALQCYPSHSHLVYNSKIVYPATSFVLVKGKGMSASGTFTVSGYSEASSQTDLHPPTKTYIEVPTPFNK